jgi:prepilin-type N-terminal cleavage/methylation domain-containing protein
MPKNNKGFTLVELLVTVAVAAIVMGGAVGLIMTGYKQYHGQNTNINLQYEAQLAMNQLEDLILNATNGIAYEKAADAASATLTLYSQGESEADDGTTTTQNIVTTVVWDSVKSQLYLSKYNYVENADGSTERAPISTNQLMADYIENFSIDLADLSEKKMVGIAMDFSFDEKSYSTKNDVKLRNSIGLATDATAFTNERISLEALATSIVVTPSSMTIERGHTAANGFSTYVVGTNYPLQDVTWAISDTTQPTDENTTVDPSTGIMTIGPNETQTEFTLVVSSVTPNSAENSDSKATETVKVRNKYATSLTVNSITLTGETTALITVYVEGYNFEETDVASYQGISLSFTDAEGKRISSGDMTGGSWSGSYSSDQQLTYTTTITLNNEAYMDEEITVIASKTGLDSGTGTVEFPSTKIEEAEIVLYDASKTKVATSSGAYLLDRGETYEVRIAVTYGNGKTEEIKKGDELWNGINWSTNLTETSTGKVTYEDGTLTVKNDLTWAKHYTNLQLITSSSVEGLNKLSACINIPSVKLVIVQANGTSNDNVFPLLTEKNYTLNFEVTGISSNYLSGYKIVCTNESMLSSYSYDASAMTATIKRNNNTQGSIELEFGLSKNNQTVSEISASIKLAFGNSNVYEKTSNSGFGDNKYNSISMYLPAPDSSKESTYKYYLLDGTVIVVSRKSSYGNSSEYTLAYNGKTYKWTSNNGPAGWYEQ